MRLDYFSNYSTFSKGSTPNDDSRITETASEPIEQVSLPMPVNLDIAPPTEDTIVAEAVPIEPLGRGHRDRTQYVRLCDYVTYNAVCKEDPHHVFLPPLSPHRSKVTLFTCCHILCLMTIFLPSIWLSWRLLGA